LESDDGPEEMQVTLVDLTSIMDWDKDDDALRLLTPIFLVRDEYIQLDLFMESEMQNVLLLGQPGIGMCIYLSFHPLMQLFLCRKDHLLDILPPKATHCWFTDYLCKNML